MIHNTERERDVTDLTVRVDHATDESRVDRFSVSLPFYQLQHCIRDLHTKPQISPIFSNTHTH